jgi:hypothetical protein
VRGDVDRNVITRGVDTETPRLLHGVGNDIAIHRSFVSLKSTPAMSDIDKFDTGRGAVRMGTRLHVLPVARGQACDSLAENRGLAVIFNPRSTVTLTQRRLHHVVVLDEVQFSLQYARRFDKGARRRSGNRWPRLQMLWSRSIEDPCVARCPVCPACRSGARLPGTTGNRPRQLGRIFCLLIRSRRARCTADSCHGKRNGGDRDRDQYQASNDRPAAALATSSFPDDQFLARSFPLRDGSRIFSTDQAVSPASRVSGNTLIGQRKSPNLTQRPGCE